jgi:hypothetical protein
MQIKLFEIRDAATFIPVLAVRLSAEATDQERWLLRRAGYARDDIAKGHFILLCTLAGGNGRAICDPYDWASSTFTPAHEYIQLRWDELSGGDVIDVEFIKGLSATPKVSERRAYGDD